MVNGFPSIPSIPSIPSNPSKKSFPTVFFVSKKVISLQSQMMGH